MVYAVIYIVLYFFRYLGRKRLEEKSEEPVKGTRFLVWAGYSYWTLGYLISAQGASKLIAQDPLSNILPVDEYLPILYDKHPEYVSETLDNIYTGIY